MGFFLSEFYIETLSSNIVVWPARDCPSAAYLLILGSNKKKKKKLYLIDVNRPIENIKYETSVETTTFSKIKT